MRRSTGCPEGAAGAFGGRGAWKAWLVAAVFSVGACSRPDNPPAPVTGGSQPPADAPPASVTTAAPITGPDRGPDAAGQTPPTPASGSITTPQPAAAGLHRAGYARDRCLVCGAHRTRGAMGDYSDRQGYGFCESCGRAYAAWKTAVEAPKAGAVPGGQDVEAFKSLMGRHFRREDGEARRGLGLILLSARFATPEWDVLTGGGGESATGPVRSASVNHPGKVRAVAYSPKGETVAAAWSSGRVLLLNSSDLSMVATVPDQPGVQTLAFSPDGKLLAMGGGDSDGRVVVRGTVTLWNVEQGREHLKLPGHKNHVFSVAFSPDGKTLASGSYVTLGSVARRGELKLWDLTLFGREIGVAGDPVPDGSDGVRQVTFHQDGKRLMFSDGRSLVIFDPENGASEVLRGTDGFAFAVAPDGFLIAASGVSSRRESVALWDGLTRAPRPPLAGDTMAVFDVAFSPDGRTLASADWKKTVTLWDVGKARPSVQLHGHEDVVNRVRFSPAGGSLISGDDKGTLIRWEFPR